MIRRRIRSGLRARVAYLSGLLYFAGIMWLNAAENPIGEWEVNVKSPGGERPGKIIFEKKADGSLGGKWSSPRGDSDLENVKLEGSKLTFTRHMSRGGQEFDLNFDGKIEGDKISGTFATPQGDLELTGGRAGTEAAKAPSAAPATGAAAAAMARPNIVGDWDITSKSALGELKRKLSIKSGNKAIYDTGEEKYIVKNLKQNGNEITFNVTIMLDGNELPLAFKGTTDGSKLTGKYTSDQGDAEITGTRIGGGTATPAAPSAAKAGIVGSWDVTSESQLGTLKRKLVVKDDMTGTYELDEGKFPIKNLKQNGSEVTYSVTIEVQGNQLALDFKGKVEGDNLTGDYTSEAGGAKVTGKRMAGK